MSAFLLALAICSATGSAMGLIALLFARLRLASPRWIRTAYVCVALFLLVPWRPSLPARTARVAPVPVAVDTAVLRALLEAPVVPGAPQPQPMARPVLTPAQIAFCVWLTGALLTIGAAAVRHARFLRLTRRWRARDEAVEARLLALDGRRSPRVYRCAAVSSPMLAGFLRPALYLPEQGEPSDDVLRHELAHLRAHDLPLRAVWVLARAVHWWNPIIFILDRGCVFACEAAADARVCTDFSGEERHRYARSVLESAAPALTPLTMPLGGGKRMMKRRLSLILRERSGRLGALLLALVLMLGLCAPMTRADSAPTVAFGGNTLTGTRLDPVINGLHMGASLDDLISVAQERAWELWKDGANIFALPTDAREGGWYSFADGILSVQLNVLYSSETEAREAAQALVGALEPLYGPYDKVMQNPYNARWEEDGVNSSVRIRPNSDERPNTSWWVTFEYTGIPIEYDKEENAIDFEHFQERYPSVMVSQPVVNLNDASWASEDSTALLREVLDSMLAKYSVSSDALESDAEAAIAYMREKGYSEALMEAAGENAERFMLQMASLEMIPAASKLLQEEPGTARAALAREYLLGVYVDTFGEQPGDFDGWLSGEVGAVEAYYSK